jgi:hypothetical protein
VGGIVDGRSQVTPPEISRLTRIKCDPVEMRIPLVGSDGIRIITQHGNDLPVLPVILLMIGISLIRNIDPDTISLREALHYRTRRL